MEILVRNIGASGDITVAIAFYPEAGIRIDSDASSIPASYGRGVETIVQVLTGSFVGSFAALWIKEMYTPSS